MAILKKHSTQFKSRISIHRMHGANTQSKNYFSDFIAALGLLVAAGGLFVSYQSMKKSDKIATQALEISKTANDIALGTKIEPGILEFSTLDRSDFQYDFTDQSSLKDELRYVIHLYNRGHRPISAVSAQIIGVEPLTYQLSNPGFAIRSLPSFDWKLDFNSAVLPSGSVAIDIRKPILVYLKKLSGQLPQKNSVYMTSINFVVSTKSVGDDDFIGISGNQKIHDRELITIRFIPSIIKTEIATTILSEDTEQHRVYSP